jgi:hypothetical protein
MNQSVWIALIVVGVLVIVGIVLYLVLRHRSSSMTAVLLPIFPPNGYNPHPNGYNPHPNGYNPNLPPGPGPIPTPLPPNGYNPSLPPGPGPHPNGYNPNLPPGPGPHPNGYNPNLLPSTSHALLPGVTKQDLSEAFASAL